MSSARKHHPTSDPRPFLEPMFSGAGALKYYAITGLWLLAAGWFWAWWLQPEHLIAPVRFWIVTAGMLWIWGMQLYFVQVFLQARRPAAPDPVPGQWRVAMIITKVLSD
ncbi:hypothetical protein [Marimonas lutisalis]|uniref:hypothetical protein n=1 Tax=Marimonas lutisalis TaxID=2545756 RepID=UPI0010FA4D81|nr:hypothetical protein [Marimonas lutisalis]